MNVDMENQGYRYDDVRFNKEDSLMSIDGIKAYMDNGACAAQLAALGCLVMNIIYQGDEARDYDLMMNGDKRSDWVSLYKCTGDYKEVKGRKVRPSRKKIGDEMAFNLLLEGCELLDLEFTPHVEAKLSSEEPNLLKCLLAGMCARMDMQALSQMVLVPGADRMVSAIMQLRQ